MRLTIDTEGPVGVGSCSWSADERGVIVATGQSPLSSIREDLEGKVSRVMAFAGPPGSGKDTACSTLSPLGFVTLGIFDTPKHWAMEIFSFRSETVFGPSSERDRHDSHWLEDEYWEGVLGRVEAQQHATLSPFIRELVLGYRENRREFTARKALQDIGLEAMKAHGPQVWAREAAKSIKILQENRKTTTYSKDLGVHRGTHTGVAVCDCRFRSDAEALVGVGASIWWIDAEPRVSRTYHPSEPSREDFAGILAGDVPNKTTVGDFRTQVLRAFASLQR